MPATLTMRLARLVQRPVDDATRRRAALHVLDWTGCAAIGATTPAGRAFGVWARRQDSIGPVPAIGLGRTAAAVAVLLNGALGNVLEMDDVHRLAVLHPGPVVIPAALAASVRAGVDAAAFLDAVVRGYEAVIRVGCAVGPGHYRFFHNTASCGPFGAAAAAASAMGLDATDTAHALGLAGTDTGGFWQMRLEPNMAKQLHAARAAEAGFLAADLAVSGVTGPLAILEGPLGFFSATAPDADPDRVVAEPEAPWLIGETSFKPWPACRHAHAAIDAALALRARMADLGVGTERLAAVRVETYRDALTFCDRPDPRSVIDAKFSLQHAAAVTLLDGPPPLAAFEPGCFTSPRVAALRARVAVAAEAPYADAYPRHYGAGLTATLDDGRTLTAAIPDALGDPENPLEEARIVGKAQTLLDAAGIAARDADRAVETALALGSGGPLDAFAAALAGLTIAS